MLCIVTEYIEVNSCSSQEQSSSSPHRLTPYTFPMHLTSSSVTETLRHLCNSSNEVILLFVICMKTNGWWVSGLFFHFLFLYWHLLVQGFHVGVVISSSRLSNSMIILWDVFESVFIILAAEKENYWGGTISLSFVLALYILLPHLVWYPYYVAGDSW